MLWGYFAEPPAALQSYSLWRVIPGGHILLSIEDIIFLGADAKAKA
jgi:hypothetical protein